MNNEPYPTEPAKKISDKDIWNLVRMEKEKRYWQTRQEKAKEYLKLSIEPKGGE